MNDEQLIKRFEEMRKKTKSSLDHDNEYTKSIRDNTAIAIAYVESETETLKEYARSKTYNKNYAILSHLQSIIGRFDDKAVESAIRKHTGYMSIDHSTHLFWIIIGVSVILALAFDFFI